MKKAAIFLLVSIVSGLLVGCSSPPAEPGTIEGNVTIGPLQPVVRPGEEFSLAPGEGTIVKGQDFEITFLEVLEDSRCPREVTCIWEGRARTLVSIIRPDSGEEVELVEPGLSDQSQSLSYQGYLVNFHLLPYPRAGVETAPDDYRLNLTITKAE